MKKIKKNFYKSIDKQSQKMYNTIRVKERGNKNVILL